MKMLVTGSNGFVGKAFCEAVTNDEVIPYDLPDHDILDIAQMELFIANCDMVVHFAAVADLYETAKDPDRNFYVNVEGTYYIAKLCAKHKKKLIFISTCCVYGDTGHVPETEEVLPKTNEMYACTKVAGEYILRGTPDLDYLILRIGTVYGPGMRESLFNYIALRLVSDEKPITVFGDGTQTRNYIFIDDLVRGILLAVEGFDQVSPGIINLCGREQTSVLDTIKAAHDIIGKTAVVNYTASRYGEIQDEIISFQKAFWLLGWQPKVKYYDGMERTYKEDPRFK